MEELALFAEGDLGETKAKILDAAFRRLANEGYAALSMREIARGAGVNHALINYHFRSKDELVIAVLDAANRELLARQQRMYAAPAGLRREVGAGAALLPGRPRLGLRARAGGALGGEPLQPGPAREVPAAPARLEATWCSGRCATRWRPSRRKARSCRRLSPPR